MSTSTAYMRTSTCKKCGDPTWNGAQSCPTCKRKAKTRDKCDFPHCAATFWRTGKAKYCPEHKSMTPSQRLRAIKLMQEEQSAHAKQEGLQGPT